MSDVTLRDLLQWLAEERNLDLRGYKTSSLERRFRHRMFQVKVGGYGEYLDFIREKRGEVNDLLNTVLINVTHFFRDPQAWEALGREIIPELAERLQPGDTFRAWSAGCASGEEAYSLAILLCEQFGADIRNYDVKVYATDVDEEALNIARRGEYPTDKLRHVRPEWREKYFRVDHVGRISREIRRLCIFGRGNLASDAPISHVQLLLCRNVLIYFDSDLQKSILRRLHYALEPDGVLMLGKSESQLSQNALFRTVNPKWRIFRRLEQELGNRQLAGRAQPALEEAFLARTRQDLSLLKTYQDVILQTVEPGILVLNNADTVITENESALRLFGIKGEPTVGKKFVDTGIAKRAPEVVSRLEGLHKSGEPMVVFECSLAPENHEPRALRVTLRTISTAKGGRAGTLVYIEDITTHQKLQHTVEELETTSEELQSSNEELETTNEELQSTNEELETTNEELQSTNEELETTNEELQALNEELGTTNEELEVRTRELDELNARYAETLEKMPWPMMMVDSRQVVQVWNSYNHRLFGLPAKSVIGLELTQLPVAEKLRTLLARRSREASSRHKDVVVRDQSLDTNSFYGSITLRFTPLIAEGGTPGVLIMLEPVPAKRPITKRVASRANKPNRRQPAANKKKRR
jgi:two-component system, chemotaxis family, CheB/CheR fusion protein